jgi:hypothetical protein
MTSIAMSPNFPNGSQIALRHGHSTDRSGRNAFKIVHAWFHGVRQLDTLVALPKQLR